MPSTSVTTTSGDDDEHQPGFVYNQLMNTSPTITVLAATLVVAIAGCGSDESTVDPVTREVSQASYVGYHQSCNDFVGPYCQDPGGGVFYCEGDSAPNVPGLCVSDTEDPYNCGAAHTNCQATGKVCRNSACVDRCSYMDDCADSKICVPSYFVDVAHYNWCLANDPCVICCEPFLGDDKLAWGACVTQACTTDAQCTALEPYETPVGANSDSIPSTNPDLSYDNKLKCCSGRCRATAHDPKNCGACGNNVCTLPGQPRGCYSYMGGIIPTWSTTNCSGANCVENLGVDNGHYERMCP